MRIRIIVINDDTSKYVEIKTIDLLHDSRGEYLDNETEGMRIINLLAEALKKLE